MALLGAAPIVGAVAFGDGGGLSFAFNRDGTINGSVYTGPSVWVSPQSGTVGDSYWVRYNAVSGPVPSGSAINTWLPLSINRGWQASGPASVNSGTLQVATDGAGANIVGSATFTLNGSL